MRYLQAQSWGVQHFETSAKTRYNVDEAFAALVREVRKRDPLYQKMKQEREREAKGENGRKKKPPSSGCVLI